MGRNGKQCKHLSSHRLLLLVPALPGSSTCCQPGPGILRLQMRLGLPNKGVQQETFLEPLGKGSPMQPLHAGPHLKPPGNFANGSHPGIQGPAVAVGTTWTDHGEDRHQAHWKRAGLRWCDGSQGQGTTALERSFSDVGSTNYCYLGHTPRDSNLISLGRGLGMRILKNSSGRSKNVRQPLDLGAQKQPQVYVGIVCSKREIWGSVRRGCIFSNWFGSTGCSSRMKTDLSLCHK